MKELVYRAQAGDVEAKNQLADESRRFIYQRALAIAKNHQDADDITQICQDKIFLENKLSKVREPDKFKIWLRKMVKNEAVDFFETNNDKNLQQIRRRLDKGKIAPGDLDQLRYQAEGPEQRALRLEQEAQIDEAVEELKPKTRAIVRDRYWEEMRYREIASKRGISDSDVSHQLSEGNAKLRPKCRSRDLIGILVVSSLGIADTTGFTMELTPPALAEEYSMPKIQKPVNLSAHLLWWGDVSRYHPRTDSWAMLKPPRIEAADRWRGMSYRELEDEYGVSDKPVVYHLSSGNRSYAVEFIVDSTVNEYYGEPYQADNLPFEVLASNNDLVVAFLDGTGAQEEVYQAPGSPFPEKFSVF